MSPTLEPLPDLSSNVRVKKKNLTSSEKTVIALEAIRIQKKEGMAARTAYVKAKVAELESEYNIS